MEYFFPIEKTQAALTEFLDFQDSMKSQHDSNVALQTDLRFVAADEMWLSPMYMRNSSGIFH
jgi:hypothetical protein